MKKLFLIIATFLVFSGFSYAGININTATQSELETLQGIGPVKAKAIIEYREEQGAFVSKDDLVNVDGVGPGTLKQLRDHITVKAKVVVNQERKQP